MHLSASRSFFLVGAKKRNLTSTRPSAFLLATPLLLNGLIYVGTAKAQLGADAEAVSWMRRGLDANRNYSIAHFHLGAALARLGELEQARTAVQAGLALDPNFTIHRFRTYAPRDKRLIEGMRLAGVPEG